MIVRKKTNPHVKGLTNVSHSYHEVSLYKSIQVHKKYGGKKTKEKKESDYLYFIIVNID